MVRYRVFLLLLVNLLEFCLCHGRCNINSTIDTLEMLSNHLTSHVKSTSPSSIQHLIGTEVTWNFYNWSSHILAPEADPAKQLTDKYLEDINTATSVLTTILSNVLKEKGDNNINIITDLQFGSLLLDALKEQLYKEGYDLEIQTIFPEEIPKLESIVLGTLQHPMPFVVLLLPNHLANLVLKVAEKNYLLNKDRKITWVGFDLGQLQFEDHCIQNIPSKILFEAMYFDQSCNLQTNEKIINDLSNEMTRTIFKCEENYNEIIITSLIDEPFVKLVESEVDPLGRQICVNSLKCSNPTTLENRTIIWQEMCCAGLVIDILQEFIKRLNFNFKIYICPDGLYGGFDRNGNWTGMINEVYSRRADIAMQGITVNTQRSKVVDFTEGFMLTTFGIIRRKHVLELPVVNWEFLKTLEADLIFGLIASFVLVFVFIFGYENLIYFAYKGKYYPTREAFSYIAGLTFQRDLAGKTPNKWSARLIAIAYAIAMTIVMTTYTANLTANNITKTDKDDFKGLKDEKIIDPTPEFTYGIRSGTSSEFYFKNNVQPGINQIYHTFIKHYLTKTNTEGFIKVKKGILDGYVGDYIYMLYKLVKPEYCSTLTIHKQSYMDFPLGFAVQKNSKWKYLLSQIIRDLRDSGKLQKIIEKWFYLPKCLENQAQANKFPWEYIGGMLLAVGVFVLISLTVMFVETCYTKRKEAKNKNTIPVIMNNRVQLNLLRSALSKESTSSTTVTGETFRRNNIREKWKVGSSKKV